MLVDPEEIAGPWIEAQYVGIGDMFVSFGGVPCVRLSDGDRGRRYGFPGGVAVHVELEDKVKLISTARVIELIGDLAQRLHDATHCCECGDEFSPWCRACYIMMCAEEP